MPLCTERLIRQIRQKEHFEDAKRYEVVQAGVRLKHAYNSKVNPVERRLIIQVKQGVQVLQFLSNPDQKLRIVMRSLFH